MKSIDYNAYAAQLEEEVKSERAALEKIKKLKEEKKQITLEIESEISVSEAGSPRLSIKAQVMSDPGKTKRKERPPLMLTDGTYPVYAFRRAKPNNVVECGILIKDKTGACKPRRLTIPSTEHPLLYTKVKDLCLPTPNLDENLSFERVGGVIGEIGTFDTTEPIGTILVKAARGKDAGSIGSIKDLFLTNVSSGTSSALVLDSAQITPNPAEQFEDFLLVKASVKEFRIPVKDPMFTTNGVLTNKYKYNPNNPLSCLNNEQARGHLLEIAIDSRTSKFAKWMHDSKETVSHYDFEFPRFTWDIKGVILMGYGLPVDDSKFADHTKMADLISLFFLEIEDINGASYFHIVHRGYLTKAEIIDRKDEAFDIGSGAQKFKPNMLNKP